MKSLFIDLYAGLGGASQAFTQAEGWDVMQFDNNPDLIAENPQLIIADILEFTDVYYQILRRVTVEDYQRVVVWMSPPCVEFSLAYGAPKSVAQRANKPFHPSLDLLNAGLRIKNNLATLGFDKFIWIVENVRGASPYFEPALGRFRQQIGSFFLWGNFPLITLMSPDRTHTKPDKRHSPLRANIRAKIPFEYSKALLDAIENQTDLTSYQ